MPLGAPPLQLLPRTQLNGCAMNVEGCPMHGGSINAGVGCSGRGEPTLSMCPMCENAPGWPALARACSSQAPMAAREPTPPTPSPPHRHVQARAPVPEPPPLHLHLLGNCPQGELGLVGKEMAGSSPSPQHPISPSHRHSLAHSCSPRPPPPPAQPQPPQVSMHDRGGDRCMWPPAQGSMPCPHPMQEGL